MDRDKALTKALGIAPGETLRVELPEDEPDKRGTHVDGPRYFADTFDADGKHYVFDAHQRGDEVAGPFPTIADAQRAADKLNRDKE